MLEQHVRPSVTCQRLRTGPAGKYVDGFADWLSCRGHKPSPLLRMLQAFASWTDWLAVNGMTSNDFATGLRECSDYIESLPHVRYRYGPNQTSMRVARLFMKYLDELGILMKEGCSHGANEHPILDEFTSWMTEQRGVVKTTLKSYRHYIRDFFAICGTDPNAYRPEVLRNYVLERARSFRRHTLQSHCTAIRSFLRFLGATGRCAAGMEHFLPPIAGWRMSSIPKYLQSADVERLIASCTDSSAGVRDKAILLLLARLGMRAGDVVRLRMDDIEWENGIITVCGKGRHYDVLPLPQEVGTAILAYLKDARRACNCAEVFTTAQLPFKCMCYLDYA